MTDADTPYRPSLSLTQKMILGWGKVRRFWYGIFCRDYIVRASERRSGECRRCGASCKLMIYCPSLNECVDPNECVRHTTRPKNCRIFPVDEADLRDRDLVMPDQPCGFAFASSRHGK